MVTLIVLFLTGILVEYSKLSGRMSERIEQKWPSLRFPKARKRLYKLITAYLLTRIGLVGGAELVSEGMEEILVSGAAAVLLSISLCLLALWLLTALGKFEQETRISLATHAGSVSVGTFAAVIAFLEGANIPYSQMVGAWVALMELPAVLLGVLLLGQGTGVYRKLLRSEKSLLLLPLALLAGLLVGPALIQSSVGAFVLESAFEPILLYFLFEMGRQAGANLHNLNDDTLILVGFGVLMPVTGGTIGMVVARSIGLSPGDATVLATLAASLSYIAAPTAMSSAITALRQDDQLAKRAVSTSLAVSLGVALPFNVLVGIRLYHFQAQLDTPSFTVLTALVAATALVASYLSRRPVLLTARNVRRLAGSANAKMGGLLSKSGPLRVQPGVRNVLLLLFALSLLSVSYAFPESRVGQMVLDALGSPVQTPG